ncbi:MAG: DUF2264 domain-containing protein, partial [Nonomuraea sp.]|nr:DUF2264 domain-containing protein [Nonomuraea sp.]
AYDHYVGWALHFYPLIWTEMAAGEAAADARRPVHLERLGRYLRDAVHLVGADGSPLVQGRSLTYRFAAATPFWAGARAGVAAPGLLRRAASGIARHVTEHGVPDEDGVLTLGWHRAWRPIAQSYSGPGSPYWAAKGLFGLALPAGHPVWTAVEEPLPVESGDFQLVARAPGWLVGGTRDDGIVRVVNHGTDHSNPGTNLTDSPLYARLGYSTATAPLQTADPLDQSVVLLDEGRPSHRTGFETTLLDRLPSGTVVGASRWRAHWVTVQDGDHADHGGGRTGTTRLGPWLEVVSAVRGPWEVRLVRLDGEPSGPLRVSGWPVPAGGDGVPRSLLVPGPGLAETGVLEAEDVSPLAPRAAVPWCAGDARPGLWYDAMLFLGRDPGDPPTLTWDDAETAHVTWPDGTRDRLATPTRNARSAAAR